MLSDVHLKSLKLSTTYGLVLDIVQTTLYTTLVNRKESTNEVSEEKHLKNIG
jgi:hypothetical protein